MSTERLVVKSDGRIRPIRVEFDSVMARETACRNARELRDSVPYRNKISISRDKIREDRERDRAKYLAYKQQRAAAGSHTGSGTPETTGTIETTVPAGNSTVVDRDNQQPLPQEGTDQGMP